MKKLRVRPFVIIVSIIMLAAFFNYNLGMLCFCLFFQTVSIIGVVGLINSKRKFNKAPVVDASLIDFRSIKGYEDEAHNYEGSLEFFWPNSDRKYIIKHKFSSLTRPGLNKAFKIAIDVSDPSNSIAKEELGWYLYFRMGFYICISLSLIYVEYIYMGFLTKK